MKSPVDKNIFIILFALLPAFLVGQAEAIFNDIRFYQPLEEVKPKIKAIAESVKVIAVNEPRFPLADKKETHLICTNVKTAHGTIKKVGFTFSDDQLTYIEARGNAVNALTDHRKDTAMVYLDYEAYFSDLLFANVVKDIAWLLTQESVHPNLFTWENPYLNAKDGDKQEYYESARVPDFIKMGAHIDELRPLLKSKSTLMNEEQLDGSDPYAQVQLNCFGIEYAGFPRKIEARFGDDHLNMVWILTGKGEESRLREKLIEAYGEPVFVNEVWEAFEGWEVMLRKDKPEVLLMTKELGQFYKKEYFKQ